jgi:hypothetical protein
MGAKKTVALYDDEGLLQSKRWMCLFPIWGHGYLAVVYFQMA